MCFQRVYQKSKVAAYLTGQEERRVSHLHGFALWLEHTLAVISWVRVRPAVARMGVLPLLFRALRADPHQVSLSPELNHPSTPLSLP